MYKLNGSYLVFKSFSTLEGFSNIAMWAGGDASVRACVKDMSPAPIIFKHMYVWKTPVMLTVLYEENDP